MEQKPDAEKLASQEKIRDEKWNSLKELALKEKIIGGKKEIKSVNGILGGLAKLFNGPESGYHFVVSYAPVSGEKILSFFLTKTSECEYGKKREIRGKTVTYDRIVVKGVIIWDYVNLGTANDPKAIPGGGVGSGTIIRYTITISNAAGATTATLSNIEDVLPLTLDTQFGDGSDANVALSGADNVRITDGLGAVAFCQADNGDTNTDGCRDDGGVGGNALVVDLAAVAGITNSLAATQSLTIEFDVELP